MSTTWYGWFVAPWLPSSREPAKPPILRAYLERWGWEVGKFFEGVDRNADDDTLTVMAPGFPVFRVETDK